ncbi:hypothetical protein C8Q70DRAFT_1036760 [Cubamyces menziesii]|nr:hypothetical protein C8Q70DRAFT_1036760 [Cubamyces menziesii]
MDFVGQSGYSRRHNAPPAMSRRARPNLHLRETSVPQEGQEAPLHRSELWLRSVVGHQKNSGRLCVTPGYVARDHVHPCPRPWKHPKQLIIAFPYRSPSAILGTWPMPRKTPNSRNHPPG